MLWDIHSTCRLCHAVYGFIFIEHLRVVLFFHLDICQKFAHIGIPECKHIGIIRSGHHFSEPMLSVARKLSFSYLPDWSWNHMLPLAHTSFHPCH